MDTGNSFSSSFNFLGVDIASSLLQNMRKLPALWRIMILPLLLQRLMQPQHPCWRADLMWVAIPPSRSWRRDRLLTMRAPGPRKVSTRTWAVGEWCLHMPIYTHVKENTCILTHKNYCLQPRTCLLSCFKNIHPYMEKEKDKQIAPSSKPGPLC